ncbi:MAG: hypothetical protein LBU62_01925 [Bacteroidales bacterium]|nr:hypothetical protein [Bacteroidales bacterium]
MLQHTDRTIRTPSPAGMILCRLSVPSLRDLDAEGMLSSPVVRRLKSTVNKVSSLRDLKLQTRNFKPETFYRFW